MKPDKKTCLYCGKEIDGKKLYCDDAHRMAYKRQSEQEPEHLDNPNTNKPEQKLPEQQVEHETEQVDDLRSTLTKTDKTFYDRAMKEWGEPYYHFDGPLKKAKCGYCETSFTTNLSLNRYCSYKHYHESLTAVVR